MEGLEILKKEWKNEKELPHFSKDEIFLMIKSKSFSVTKTLLFFGLIEISLWLLLEFIDNEFSFKKLTGLMMFRIVQFVLFFVLIIVYYHKINTAESSKKLMISILNLRKIIFIYIILIFAGALFYFISNYDDIAKSVIAGWIDGKNGNPIDTTHIEKVKIPYKEKLIIVGGIMAFTLPILMFIYKVTYGELLKKLKENYHELSKSENDN